MTGQPEEAETDLIIRQCGWQSQQSNVFLRRFHLSNRSGDEALDDWTAVVVKKVDLVEDDEADELCEGSLGTLACHDVPLLGSANNQLKQKKRQVWHFTLVAIVPMQCNFGEKVLFPLLIWTFCGYNNVY